MPILDDSNNSNNKKGDNGNSIVYGTWNMVKWELIVYCLQFSLEQLVIQRINLYVMAIKRMR